MTVVKLRPALAEIKSLLSADKVEARGARGAAGGA